MLGQVEHEKKAVSVSVWEFLTYFNGSLLTLDSAIALILPVSHQMLQNWVYTAQTVDDPFIINKRIKHSVPFINICQV